MNIPKNIKFDNFSGRKIFDSDSGEYKSFKKINGDGSWKEYANEMLCNGISVRYDISSDVFVVMDLNYNELTEAILLEGIDHETSHKELSFLIDDEDDEDEVDEMPNDAPDEVEITNNPTATTPAADNQYDKIFNVVALDDVLSIIEKGLGGKETMLTSNFKEEQLEDGDEALKRVYFQGNGNETLDSDFGDQADVQSTEAPIRDNNTGITEDPVNPAPYMNYQNKPSKPDTSLGKQIDPVNPSNLLDMYNCHEDCYDVTGSKKFSEGDSITKGMDVNNNHISVNSGGENYTLYKKDFQNKFKPHQNGEAKEMLLDIQEDEMNPENVPGYNIDGLPSANNDFNAMDNPIDKFVKKDGIPIRIVLDGMILLGSELGYISEAVRSAGKRLKSIKGEKKRLKIFFESNNKEYCIEYVDAPRSENNKPFSIIEDKKMKTFGSLNEAINSTSKGRNSREKELFELFLNEDTSTREINNIKGADIFDILKEVNAQNSFYVKSAGSVNLKNGLNEVFSNILSHKDFPNTLVKNEKDEYFLIRGSLREAANDMSMINTRGNKSYGKIQIVEKFANTQEGLGEIMYKVKKTCIPLFVTK